MASATQPTMRTGKSSGATKTQIDMIIICGNGKVMTQVKDSDKFGKLLITPFTRKREKNERDAEALLRTADRYFNGVSISEVKHLVSLEDGGEVFNIFTLTEGSIRQFEGSIMKIDVKKLQSGTVETKYQGKNEICAVSPVFMQALKLLPLR